MRPPLNQSYQQHATLASYPEVAKIQEAYEGWCLDVVKWEPHALHPTLGKPGVRHIGRSYDVAVTLAQIDFDGLVVAELGARASHLPAWLTGSAAEVYASDLFGRPFRNLGDEPYWDAHWKRAAFDPERLHTDTQDMSALTYPDEMFDVVISFSAIEHIVNDDGDIAAAREMGRVCKPGGKVVLSTDLAETFRLHNGFYYDENALFERLIEPTGLVMSGAADLSWDSADKHMHKSGEFFMSACIFVLEKL